MTEVLHTSPNSSSSPSPSSSTNSPGSSLSCAPPAQTSRNGALFLTRAFTDEEEEEEEEEEEAETRVSDGDEEAKERDKDRDQLSLLALLVTLFRKSFWVACKADKEGFCGMEIGWPTNVRHVAHVTFDRFNGFLGLPVEFEPEVPMRAPSASTTVFGVSTESMQLTYDPRGNSVPTILMLMQRRLYAQGGLQAEGIFRINAENSQEEYVRDQLNRGIIPDGIDVHCLAGLIKAWFRELPTGILDSLSPEQVIESQSEDECVALVRLLPATESALLDWAVNLMADVVQMEHFNKMNARNIAMVFAPNMTQMVDPLTALMYAVQVMNFLKTLITKTLRDREDSVVESGPLPRMEPSDENGHQNNTSLPLVEDDDDTTQENEETEPCYLVEEPFSESVSVSDLSESLNITDGDSCTDSTCTEEGGHEGSETPNQAATFINAVEAADTFTGLKARVTVGQSSGGSNLNKDLLKIICQQPVIQVVGPVEKSSKGMSNLSRVNSRIERIEAWR